MQEKRHNFYIPLRNQSVIIITTLVPLIIFSVVQLFRIEEQGSYGLITYYFSNKEFIPNDYKLLLYGSIFTSVFLFFNLLNSSIIIDDYKESFLEIFIKSALRIIPLSCNLFILSFFLYLFIYRGLWALSELKDGLAFSPFLKCLFFVTTGYFSIKSFSHIYLLKTYIKSGDKDKAIGYVLKYKLFNL